MDMDDSDWYSAEVYVRGTNLLAKFSKQSGNVKTDYQYYTQNAHGDVVNLTDADGAITKSYTYDAFGVEVHPDTGDANVFRFCGEYFDTETGTVYLRARYYNPTTGRFISRDSYTGKNEDPLSLNLYTYCNNNPIIYADFTGNNPLLIVAGVALTATDLILMASIVALATLAIYSTTPSGQQAISNASTAVGGVVGDVGETVGEWRESASESLKKHKDIIKAGIGIGITSIAKSSTLEKTKQKKDNKEIEVFLAERNFSLTGPTINVKERITEEAINVIINNGSEGVYTKKKSDAEYLARKASEKMNKSGFVLHNNPQNLNKNQEIEHYHSVLSSGKEGKTHVWFGNIRQRRRAN